jgi:adenylate cyclase
MWQLLAEGRDPQQRAKQRLERGVTCTIGRSSDCDFPIPWEPWMSRRHLELTIRESDILLSKSPTAANPVFVSGKAVESAVVVPGQSFVVGETKFLVRQLGPLSPLGDDPVQEIAFTQAELSQVRFEDADRRLEALARLPGVINLSLNQEEQSAHLAALILAGIRQAEGVAVVTLDAADAMEVNAWQRRTETQGSVRPSLGLVRDAMHARQSMLYVWETSPSSSVEYTVQAESDWAFCTPISTGPGTRWGIYVTGKRDQPEDVESLRRNLQSDIRFTQMVGEVISSSKRVNQMQGQVSVLRQFLSPPILSALEATGRNGELNADLLQPKICQVTVLFCDVRGFSHRAEESQHDLQGLLARVNGALEVMTSSILEHGGVTGDFLGDAVLGFWGWPFPSEDAPLRACRAALRIRQQFLRIQRSQHHPLSDFRVGVGVAHGRAIAGKIGTGGRITVTVFGPVVNLASRLEGMTKRLHVPVIIDEATAKLARAGLTANEGRVRSLAAVLPYGVETPLVISELLPPQGEFSELSDVHLAMFERGVEHFLAGRWEQAYQALHEVPSSDQAQDFLLALITQHNRIAPLGWKGVIELGGK